MDTTAHVLEITPPRRDAGPSAKVAIGVHLLPHLVLLAVLVLLAISLPFARFILGVWLLYYAIAALLITRAIRRRQTGVLQTPILWLSSDSVGFTNGRGVTVTCHRNTVASAVRIFATVNRQTRDLLIFRDTNDNAVLSAPLAIWQPDDVDRVTEALSIPPAARKFVNTAAELETAAHGAEPPRAAAGSRNHRWIVVLGIYAIVIAVVVVALVTQR